MNILYGLISQWITDGSNGSLTQTFPELTASSSSQGTPYNVMFDIDLASLPTAAGSMYYQVEVQKLNGSLSVGVVKREEFLAGWKTRGMFYNGNVINGSAALIVGFGEHPVEGSTVGVYVCREELSNETRVVFYWNNQCLGTAFQLNNDDAKNHVYLPCIQVCGEVTLEYSAPEDLPRTIEREYPKASDPYVGNWKLEEAFVGPELGQFPLPTDLDIILRLSPANTADAYNLALKVANQLHTTVKKVGKIDGSDEIKVGPVASTLMMPPPHLRKVERYLAESLPILYKMSAHDNLVLTGATAEMICSRFYETFAPVNKY